MCYNIAYFVEKRLFEIDEHALEQAGLMDMQNSSPSRAMHTIRNF